MFKLDNETTLKILTAIAALFAAIIAGSIAFYTQWKIKQFENRLQRKKDKANERLKFYLPLLRFSYELDGRIGRILSNLSKDWLRRDYLDKIKQHKGFAKSTNETGYFIMSSVYMLACFFGWTEAIKKGVDPTKHFSEKGNFYRWFSRIRKKFKQWFKIPEKRNIFLFDPDISTVSRLFQYQELFKDYILNEELFDPKDACVFHKQMQHSIGELMLEKDNDNLRCKTFREFFDAYLKDEKFRYWFVPLENLLIDLSDFASEDDIEAQSKLKNDIRPLRLLAIRYWCRVLMQNMSKELNIETLSPDEVLTGLSTTLKDLIVSVKIEKLDSYLLGIKLKSE